MAYKSTFLKENLSLKSEIHRLQDAMKELNKQLPTGKQVPTTRTALGESNKQTSTANSELKRLQESYKQRNQNLMLNTDEMPLKPQLNVDIDSIRKEVQAMSSESKKYIASMRDDASSANSSKPKLDMESIRQEVGTMQSQLSSHANYVEIDTFRNSHGEQQENKAPTKDTFEDYYDASDNDDIREEDLTPDLRHEKPLDSLVASKQSTVRDSVRDTVQDSESSVVSELEKLKRENEFLRRQLTRKEVRKPRAMPRRSTTPQSRGGTPSGRRSKSPTLNKSRSRSRNVRNADKSRSRSGIRSKSPTVSKTMPNTNRCGQTSAPRTPRSVIQMEKVRLNRIPLRKAVTPNAKECRSRSRSPNSFINTSKSARSLNRSATPGRYRKRHCDICAKLLSQGYSTAYCTVHGVNRQP